MTARSSYRHRLAQQFLIEARRQVIQECCQSSPLDLRPDFYSHGGKEYAGISHWGTKLEISLGSGAWASTTPCSSHDGGGELPGPVGVVTGEKENFLLVLEKVFARRNMRGT